MAKLSKAKGITKSKGKRSKRGQKKRDQALRRQLDAIASQPITGGERPPKPASQLAELVKTSKAAPKVELDDLDLSSL